MCSTQNSCSKIGKILGKSLCRSPILETLPCNFIKTAPPLTADVFLGKYRLFLAKQFHKNTSERLIWKVFICLVSQIIIASAGQLSKCNRRSTVAFRIQVKSHKNISKFTGKNLRWNSLIIKLQSPTSSKENSITSVFLLILLKFSEHLI